MKYTLAFLFVAATAILMISAPSPPAPSSPRAQQLDNVLGRARQLAEEIREAQAAPSPPTYQQLERFVMGFVEVSDFARELAEQRARDAQRDNVLGALPSLEEVQRLVVEANTAIVAWLPAPSPPGAAQSVAEIREVMRSRAQQQADRFRAGEIRGDHIGNAARTRRWNFDI